MSTVLSTLPACLVWIPPYISPLRPLILIVSLPELLAQTNMDQQSVSRLREEIGKFTVWLGRNCEIYFVSEYETPSQEYIDKARSF